MGIKLKVVSGELHPEGWFPLCIKGADARDSQFGPGVRWRLESNETDETGDKLEVDYLTSLKASPRSNLGRLLAACGMEADGESSEFDSDDLLGQVIEGLIEHREGKGGTFANVVNVRPRKARKERKEEEGPSSGEEGEFVNPFANE